MDETTDAELTREGCYRVWLAAVMQYARDCRLTLRAIRAKERIPDDEAAAAWRDLEAGGQQLAWLCECCGLDVEYTRSALVAWLAEKCDIDATGATQQDAAACNRPSQTPLGYTAKLDPRYTVQSNQAACHAV